MNRQIRKQFDCIEMKRNAQTVIYEETKDMTPQEQIEYFRRGVQESAFRDWWKRAGNKTGSPSEISEEQGHTGR